MAFWRYEPIHRHIEVLLFSISFIISLLFGDIETEKWAHSVSPADKNIAIFSEQNEEHLPLLFHKMLEGLC